MSFTHPRRTTKASSAPMADKPNRPMVNTAMALRKGATFHSPSSSSSDEGFVVPSLPRRSDTSLEDVVDAHRRRVALTLGDLDRRLLSSDSPSSPSSSPVPSFRDDSLPVPRGFLANTVSKHNAYEPSEPMDAVQEPELIIGKSSLRSYHNRRVSHGHGSDSGLGSSIMSASEKDDQKPSTETKTKASAITRSAAARAMEQPRLSARASHRITEHILRPLLAKPSLKDFRPIVRDCPRRIQQREIVCLRDLEKTLIFMAPERAKSVELYLDFCLTSIRCIQATVEFLSDREQTRPHDRPYTNGYFIDLVDQIRQYAQQVQAAKAKKDKGEALDEMDAEATDEVKLYGGLTRNGRPAELVRMKNGKPISIATGEPVEEEEDSKAAFQMKRSWTQGGEEDEDILRSMARRKRNATAEELAPKRCREPGCHKEFKRPCDLTKHEKTHSRPWKCPHKDCKFHEQGWPTEKELGRHINDKHSTAPKYFACAFAPCPYKSKRESNCKQHMEKSHGWTYIRSKNNGKNRPKESPAARPSMTPSSESATIPTPDMMDTDTIPHIFEDPMIPSLYGDDASVSDFKDDKSTSMWDTTQAFPPLEMDFSPMSTELSTPGFGSSHTSPYLMDTMANFPTDNQQFNSLNGDFDLFGNEDLYSANVQLPTPSNAIFQRDLGQQFGQSLSVDTDHIHLSPVGQGNAMLFTPSSLEHNDEFDEFNDNMMGDDFTLYPPVSSNGQLNSTLFGEIPSNLTFGGQDFMQQFYAANTGMEWADDTFNA